MGRKRRREDEDDPEKTNLSLLFKTQQYLRELLQRRAPDSLLVAAWSEFYRVYSEIIRRFVRYCKVPDAQVDDCVQEVWLAVAKHLQDFEHPIVRPGLRAWLYRLVRSKAADVLRRIKRLPEALDPKAEQRLPDPHALDVWDRLFVEMLLEELAAGEPAERCHIFRMKMLEGRKTSEVCKLLNVRPHVVRYHYKKMLHQVQRRLSLYGGSAVNLVDDSLENGDQLG